MTTLHDTAGVVVGARQRMDYPRVDLDTVYGKVYLVMSNDKCAHLGTDANNQLTINGVLYKISCQFKYGRPPHEQEDTPLRWYRVQSYGMNLRRKDWSSTGKEYTEAAYAAVSEKIVPLVCSFLTQSPDMVKQAVAVDMNNQIYDVEQTILKLRNDMKDLEDQYGKLIDAEEGL